MKTKVYSHVGLKRTNQEDSYLLRPDLGLFAVADGMGGHDYGEVASQTAIKKLEEIGVSHNELIHQLIANTGTREIAIGMMLKSIPETLVAINNAVRIKGFETNAKMGSTLSFLWFVPGSVFVGHTGDSVIYRYRNRVLQRLTSEHKMGPYLLGGVGVQEDVVGEHHVHSRKEGDAYLLVSDGVTTHLSDEDIAARFLAMEHIEDNLLVLPYNITMTALTRGGVDNITAMIVIDSIQVAKPAKPAKPVNLPFVVRYGGPF